MVDEAIATDGDQRRICDLFGVTIATAQHYAGVLGRPVPTGPNDDRTSRGEQEPCPP